MKRSQATFWLCLLAFLVLLLVSNSSTPLWDQDEAAYAGIARNMWESGDWLTQEFIWGEIHRKPPFHLWAITSSFQVFGPSEFALRLPTVLALLAVFSLLWWGFRRDWGERSQWAALILAASFFAPMLGKIALTDGWLLLWETLCLLSLWRTLKDEKANYWPIWFWVGLAMGILTKGPAVILTVGMACLMILIFHPARAKIWRLQPWFGLPLAFVPLLLWGYVAWQRDSGQMINWMLDWYIFKRTGGAVLGQSGPPGYYLATIVVAFLPFLQRLVPAFGTWISNVRQRQAEDLFLLSWLIGSWFLWELIPSKLPAYAIGAHPVLALLIARQFEIPVAGLRLHKIGFVLQGILTIALVIGLCGGSYYLWQFAGLLWPVLLSFLALAAWLGPVYYRSLSQNRLIPIAASFGFMLLLWLGLMPRVSALREAPQKMHQYLQAESPANSSIILANVQGRPPSLPYYLGQTYRSFLEQRDPQSLAALYVSKKPMAFVLTQAQYESMQQQQPDLPEAEIFPLFSSDRVEGNAYYVVLNDAARTASRK